MDIFTVDEIDFSINKPNIKLHCTQYLSDLTAGVCLVSSTSSDTDTLLFYQSTCNDNTLRMRHVQFVADKTIQAMDLSPCASWLALATSTGRIGIIPVLWVMGTSQPAAKYWNRTDITLLKDRLPTNVQCLRWWTTFERENMAIIGTKTGRILIVDLIEGKNLAQLDVTGCVVSCDIIRSNDATFSFCLLTSESGNQWKLMLEERGMQRHRSNTAAAELGYENVDLHQLPSVNITQRSMIKKAPEIGLHAVFEPVKQFQFPQSVHLQHQSYAGKHFVGAYDKNTGRYQLFDTSSLDFPVYVFGLPRGALDILVTETLIYVLYRASPPHHSSAPGTPLLNTDGGSPSPSIAGDLLQSTQGIQLLSLGRRPRSLRTELLPLLQETSSSRSTEPAPLRLALLCRQHAHISGSSHSSSSSGFVQPVDLKRSIMHEFTLDQDYDDVTKDVIGMYRLPMLSAHALAGRIVSKWRIPNFSFFPGVLVTTRKMMFICHQKQSAEDVFLDRLLAGGGTEAEWLGVGLKLDLNLLYDLAAEHLCAECADSDNAKCGQLHSRAGATRGGQIGRNLIADYFHMARTPMDRRVQCLARHLSPGECLRFVLQFLRKPETLTPAERRYFSDAAVPMFARVLVDSQDSREFVYKDKFRHFVLNNYQFNEIKAVQIFLKFQLVEDAFYIARERACVVETFQYLRDMQWTTGYHQIYPNSQLSTKYMIKDRDHLLSRISSIDLDILVRSDSLLLSDLAALVGRCSTQLSPDTLHQLACCFDPEDGPVKTLIRLVRVRRGSTNTTTGASDAVSMTTLLLASTDSLADTDVNRRVRVVITERCPALIQYVCQLDLIQTKREVSTVLNGFFQLVIELSNRRTMDRSLSMAFIDNFARINTSDSFLDDGRTTPNIEDTDIEGSTSGAHTPVGDADPEAIHSTWINGKQARNSCVLDLNRHVALACSSSPTTNKFLSSKQHIPGGRLNILGLEKQVIVPVEVDIMKMAVASVALGNEHALILSIAGHVFSCGNNRFGQLGTGSRPGYRNGQNHLRNGVSALEPCRVNLPGEVLSICAGGYHSGAIIHTDRRSSGARASGNRPSATTPLTSTTEVYTWGWGVHGQLGHGDVEDAVEPQRLFADTSWRGDIIQMAMGIYHTLILTNQGKIMSFGANQFGQLGLPKVMKRSRPTLIDALNEDVVNISTKFYHSGCICDNGSVYTWGIHPNVWLSQEGLSHDDISAPSRLLISHLAKGDRGFKQISCGSTHTALLSESGRVYAVGKNMCGQLGQSHRREVKGLVQVPLSNSVDCISADDGITITLDYLGNVMVWGRGGHPLLANVLGSTQADIVNPKFFAEVFISDPETVSSQLQASTFASSGNKNTFQKENLVFYFSKYSHFLNLEALTALILKLKELSLLSDLFFSLGKYLQSLTWRLSAAENSTDSQRDRLTFNLKLLVPFYLNAMLEDSCEKIGAAVYMILMFYDRNDLPMNHLAELLLPYLDKLADPILKIVITRTPNLTDFPGQFLMELLLKYLDLHRGEQLDDKLLPLPISCSTKERSGLHIQLAELAEADDLPDSENMVYGGTNTDTDRVVGFKCGHRMTLRRLREKELSELTGRLGRRSLPLSTQLVNKVFLQDLLFPCCPRCLAKRLPA